MASKKVVRQNASKLKRLYLSNKDKKIAGVCGGVARYLGVDPTVVRLAWILLSLVWGAGLLLYLLAWLLIPKNPNANE